MFIYFSCRSGILAKFIGKQHIIHIIRLARLRDKQILIREHGKEIIPHIGLPSYVFIISSSNIFRGYLNYMKISHAVKSIFDENTLEHIIKLL